MGCAVYDNWMMTRWTLPHPKPVPKTRIPKNGEFLGRCNRTIMSSKGRHWLRCVIWYRYLSQTISFALKEMIAGWHLVDIWKKLKNDELGHTFHDSFGSSRLIDTIYASRCILEEFPSICLQPILIISENQSIQSNLKCNFDLPCRERSSVSLWKLNTLILWEEPFQSKIIQFIEIIFNSFFNSSYHPLKGETHFNCLLQTKGKND
jgi:hypothetical protein